MRVRRITKRPENKQPPGKQAPVQNNSGLNQSLSNDLNSNLMLVNQIMGNASDLIIREFTLPSMQTKAAIMLIKGLAERELINEQVLAALIQDAQFTNINNCNQLFKQIIQHGIPNILVKEEADVSNIVDELIAGNTIFFMDGVDSALIIGSQSWKDRSVSEPMTENVVRGPRDGFTETIDTNTALIRRRIKSPDLRIEEYKLGTQTKTAVLLIYSPRSNRKRIKGAAAKNSH